MNDRVLFTPESDSWPLGRAWKHYWRERNEGQTRKARSYISKEKNDARKRMHRRNRRINRKALRRQIYG